jgi:hypothetical protein
MSIDPKILKDLPPKQKAYWTRAQEFVARTGNDWISIEVERLDSHAYSDEFKAWWRYFSHLGFKPHMLVLAERRSIKTIVTPAQWPEWFDQSYHDNGGDDPVLEDQIEATRRWRHQVITPRLKAMGKAWLDRSDPLAQELSGKKTAAQLAAEARARLEAQYGIDLIDATPDRPRAKNLATGDA